MVQTPTLSRGLGGLSAAVFAGALSAGFLSVALAHANTVLIFLAYLTAVPLYAAGLGAGGLAALLASCVGAGAVYHYVAPTNAVAVYLIAFAIPATALTSLALRPRENTAGETQWLSEGSLLAAMTMYPCVLFVAATLSVWNHEGGLLAITRQALAMASEQFAQRFSSAEMQMFNDGMNAIASVMPMLLGSTWIIIALMSAVGAQYILKQRGWNLRPGFSMAAVRIPAFLIYAVAVTGLIGALAPEPWAYTGRNLSLMMGLPFFFGGLAILHAWANAKENGGFILAVFYLAYTLSSAIPAALAWLTLLIAAAGVVDQWVDFRQRIGRNNTPSSH